MLPTDASGFRRLMLSVALLGLAPLLSGCAEAVIGAGATTAVAASQERGLGGAVSDTQIRAQINYLWLEEDREMYHQLNLAVHEARVLITGVVAKQEQREEAVRRVWTIKGVREVIDEIVVDPRGTSGTYGRDAWIATQLKTKLLFDKNIYSINYSIDVVRSVVYVLGVAQDRNELDSVLNHGRSIEYVRRVVSYVLLKDDPRRTGGTVPAAAPGPAAPGGAAPSAPGTGPADAAPAGTANGGGSYGSPSSPPPPRGGGSIQSVPLDPPSGGNL